ncbi:MAG: 2'-deoxycytidine 5'-triphosphate deaminase [Cytophagales bacterium]|nr:2'-deoxycytidine 5'-triphosphate deaminase [Cytophagales bacterium]
MILTGKEIEENIRKGTITVSPFNPESINPNSINYHLEDSYIELSTDETIDSRSPDLSYKRKKIPQEGLLLQPGRLYLCNTREVIGSKHFVTSLIGRSSIGRLGIFLQVSADLGHQDEIHQWTLEIKCVKPVVIYPFMTIGQVTFWLPQGNHYPKQGFYKHFDLPTTSKGVL